MRRTTRIALWLCTLTSAAVLSPRVSLAAPQDASAPLVGASAPASAAPRAPDDAADGGAPDAPPLLQPSTLAPDDAGTTDRVWASCIEHIPVGATRPDLEEAFPERGLSGYVASLRIVLRHGRGETALPNGFRVQSDSDAARAIRASGFTLPSPDGGSAPSLSQRIEGERAVTEISIPFVPLPPAAGRHELTLPPVPIAVARANGDLVTVCTKPHVITVEDPTANEPDADPKGNPPPRRQRELWTLGRDVTYGMLIGAVIAGLLTWLALRWLRRPRPTPPPPPPRPPWELAFEELDAIRRAGLIEAGQLADHVDRVSDTTRRYLGALYSFDGIESTTDEVLASLARVVPPLPQLDRIRELLGECDLVKFARWAPTAEDCTTLIDRAEQLVRETMPRTSPAPIEPPNPAAPAAPQGAS